MIEDDHRERARAVGFENRGFERDVAGRDFDDGLVEAGIDDGKRRIEHWPHRAEGGRIELRVLLRTLERLCKRRGGHRRERTHHYTT